MYVNLTLSEQNEFTRGLEHAKTLRRRRNNVSRVDTFFLSRRRGIGRRKHVYVDKRNVFPRFDMKKFLDSLVGYAISGLT
jgi:hypothetical protein